MMHPLPDKLIKQFASSVERLFVVEELEPIIENHIKSLGIKVIGQEIFPKVGELSYEIVANRINRSWSR